MIPGSVHLANLHGDDWGASFGACLVRLIMADRQTQRIVAYTPAWTPSSRIPQSRNDTVKRFLEGQAEWLWFIDSDMSFKADILERLLEHADAESAPIMGGLCFALHLTGMTDYYTPVAKVEPTLYGWLPEMQSFNSAADWERDKVIPVAATGGACLLIHRSVLEGMRDKYGEHWFTPQPLVKDGELVDYFSEDKSFCIRAGSAGYPVHVNTAAKTHHAKMAYLSEEMFDGQNAVGPVRQQRKNFVVIPMKDNVEMTRNLLVQLRGQADAIFIYDNGSSPESRRWLREQNIAEWFPADGLGIHEMWNAGAVEAITRHVPCNIAFLNNDLSVPDDFIAGLARALDESGASVVCPNYDGRDGSGVEFTLDICANRYDGTGGMCGFAFMARGEVFDRFAFPEDALWWYGDNFLVQAVSASPHPDYPMRLGGKVGIALDVPVEHLDGGGQTGDWEAYDDTADRDAFVKACRDELGIEVTVHAA